MPSSVTRWCAFVAAAATTIATLVAAAPPGSSDPFFPQFHVRPESHWINDPNGPMYDAANDRYHLWMQYNPWGNTWGNMSWFHTISDDLVYFKRLGVSLYNDQPYDIGGVFSGSATFVNGAPVLSYTCTNGTKAQKQCAAVAVDPSDTDLKEWRKVEGNPLIAHGPEPQNDVINFRDPTVAWRLPNGTYRQAFGTSILPNVAAIALYDSPSLTGDYNFTGLLTTATDLVIPMYECPNYFSIRNFSDVVSNQRFALKVSDMESRQDFWFVGLDSRDSASGEKFQATCYPGVANCPTTGVNPPPGEMNARLVDFGKWYASTTFWDAKRSRRVLWGWIDEDWPAYNATQPWAGAQSLPRVLGYDPDRRLLTANPIPELVALRRESIAQTTTMNGSSLDGTVLNPDPQARTLWLTKTNGLLAAGAVAVSGATMPQIEVVANFTISKSLLTSSGASRIDVGLGVAHDASAVHAGRSDRAVFVGVRIAGASSRVDGQAWEGGTYWAGAVAGASVSDQVDTCEAVCRADQRCVAWSFNRDVGAPTPCVLKSKFAAPATTARSSWTAGSPGGATQPLFGAWRAESGTVGSELPHVGRAVLQELDTNTYQLLIRVFVDRSVIEAFKDGGTERVATRMYNVDATSLVSAVYRVDGITPAQAQAAGTVTLASVAAWNVGNVWEKPPPVFHPPSGVAAIVITFGAVMVLVLILSAFACRQRHKELQRLSNPKTAYTEFTQA